MKLHTIFTIAFLVLIGINVQSQNDDKITSRDVLYLTSGGKLHPLQANMDIRHYTIKLDVDLVKQSIQGSTEINLNLAAKTDTILLDLIHLYAVTKIKVNNATASFYQHDDKIFITSAKGFESGNQKVYVEYNGIPPVAVRPPWDGGFTWKKDSAGFDWVSINIQGEGGKMYFPCKDHTIIQEKINAINIEYDIGDTLRWMTDLHKKYTKNAYVAIIVYPCTHNDKEWLKKYSIINEIIPNALKYVDFRFSNNAPGTLYFGKVEIAENELIKIQTLIHGYYNKENLVINTDKIQTKKIVKQKN
jgi:hypothetical protein